MGDLMAADVELAGLYTECSIRHIGLVEWVNKVVLQNKQ